MTRGRDLCLWILVVTAGEIAQAALWREMHLPAAFSQELRDYVRRLTQQQMQTTQNMHSALLPQLNLPLIRPRLQGQPEVPDSSSLPLFKFPFQSTAGGEGDGGARSFASSSVSVKRPHGAGTNVEAQASAYASVKDVNDEEQMAEMINSEVKSPASKSSTPVDYQKSTALQEVEGSTNEETSKGEPYALKHQKIETVLKAEEPFSDVYFVAIVAGCCVVGIFGVISAGICFYKLQKSRKAAADVDYPAYGVTGPNKDLSSPNGDRKLAQSAQMYHYQHQKQQMIAVEKAGSTKNTSASDVDSEEENEEGDYTVYECPGLAPTGEMEVKNPLFHDDSTPVSPPVLTSKPDSNQNN